MNIKLSLHDCRVLGSLIEKAITTPDQYPLSLNALTNACNQKSNRDPVLNLSEADVRNTVNSLSQKHLVSVKSGSRVVKYSHRFAGTEFSEFKFNPGELAILCELFLRGPQTPGELRSRAGRMHSFESLEVLEQCLHELSQREDGPYVVKLSREPGRRESRYAHLFTEVQEEIDRSPAAPVRTTAHTESINNSDLEQRVTDLERQVNSLSEEIKILKMRL